MDLDRVREEVAEYEYEYGGEAGSAAPADGVLNKPMRATRKSAHASDGWR
ncbi:hypothetical protein L6Q96_08980 [Candidatus Binatia bacterium]|nr:hypothetical protein [Candidatus Binatia bacterium]